MSNIWSKVPLQTIENLELNKGGIELYVGEKRTGKTMGIAKVSLANEMTEKDRSKPRRESTRYGKPSIANTDLKSIKLSLTAVSAAGESRILNIAETLKASRNSREKFSLKSFMTLKPSWPPKPPAKSPESQESMISPLHSSPSPPPSPELPSRIRQLQAATKAKHILKLPMIRPGVKITYEEACCEPMDIENYYAVENLKKYINEKLDGNHLPVLYHKQYNVKILKYGVDLRQVMLFDKPTRVFSILSRDLWKAHNCMCVDWKAVDISSVYNITDFEPDIIKEYDIRKIAKLMKLKVWKLLPTWRDFDAAVLSPLRVQIMGSVVACKLALDKGWAINIGGGFGHYTTNISGGLAVYDDVLVCLAIMTKSARVKHILIINFDAYQCLNYKYASYAAISCPVTIFDFYTESIHQPSCDVNPDFSFPNTYVFYHSQKVVSHSASVDTYIAKLTILFGNPREDNPSLCIYVPGTTALAENPYTAMSFTKKDVVTRDSAVFQLIHGVNKIPIAVLLGGGYHQYDIETAAATVCQLCKSGLSLVK